MDKAGLISKKYLHRASEQTIGKKFFEKLALLLKGEHGRCANCMESLSAGSMPRAHLN